MEKPALPGPFISPDRPRRPLSREVMAEGKELAANCLCVAVRVAAALRQVNCGRLDAELELSSMSRHDHYP